MEGYKTFTMTMDKASDRCSKWKSADDGVVYSYAELMLLAAYLDRDYPLGERQWYIVFPDGEICLLHEDFDEIMPMWLPVKSKPIANKLTGDEFYPDDWEDEKETRKVSYCPHCGQKLRKTDTYCPNCGKKVS